MKKLLFSLLALMSTFSASAQTWTGEVPANGEYMLYNVGAKKFFDTGFESWGTNASLGNPGMVVKTVVSGSTVTLETTVSNGGASYFLGSNGWADQPSFGWTFTALSDGKYTLANGSNLLGAPSSYGMALNTAGSNANDPYFQWLFVSKQQRIDALDNATADNGVDASFYIKCPNLNRNDRNWNAWNQNNHHGDNKNWFREVFNTTCDVYQTITIDKPGVYVVSCQGFYRAGGYAAAATAHQNGTEELNALLYANDETSPLMSIFDDAQSSSSGGFATSTSCGFIPNSVGQVSTIFSDAALYYTNNHVAVRVEEGGSIKFGVKKTKTIGSDWTTFDAFSLTYYGDITLAEYKLAANVALYREALAKATAIDKSAKMSSTVLSALQQALTDYAEANVLTSSATMESIDAATAALNTIVANVNTSIEAYVQVAAINTKANNLDDAGKAAYAAAGITEAYNNCTLTNGSEVAEAQAAYFAAIKSQTTPGLDWSEAMINADFEMGDLTAWTSTDGGNTANNGNFNSTIFAERWIQNTALVSGSLTHDAIILPAGLYTLKVDAQNIEQYNKDAAGKGLFLRAAGEEVEIGAKGTYSMLVKLNEETSVTIAVVQDNCTGNWVCYDNFQIIYEGQDFPTLTPAEGKMNAEIAQAQTDAIAAFNSNKTVANYNAALAAIGAAQTSVEKYTAAATALANQKALIDGTNIYAASWTTGYVANYTSLQKKYDNNTLTNEDGVVNPNAFTGWHASVAYNDLLTPWTVDGTAVSEWSAGDNLHINTWSTEGDNDGSNFQVPFFESWTSDANGLTDKVIATQVTDLENGLYSVSAWVRTRTKNDVAHADASGITLTVNEGTPVDVTKGTQINDGDRAQFGLDTFTAEGLVKDGVLNITFDIKNTNISWLSFKNVKYTKVRDLTPEEQIVYATAEEIEAFNAAVEAAETKTVGFMEGEYAPYTNAAVIKALADAKAIDTENSVDIEVINAAQAAIADDQWTVNTEEVNAVYDGTFAASTNDGAPAGWVSTDKAGLGGAYHARTFVLTDGMTNFANLAAFNQGDTRSAFYMRWDGTNSSTGTWYNYGKTEGYTMPLKGGQSYILKFQAGAWGDFANKNLSVAIKNADNTTIASGKLKTTKKTSSGQGVDDFELIFTPETDGNYTIGLWNENGSNYAGIVSNITLYSCASAKMAINAEAGYGTFCAPFEVAIPSGIKAYTVEAPTEGNTLTLNEVTNSIPANTPVVLEGTLEATTVYGRAITGTPQAGLLTGVYTKTPAPVGSYILQNNDSKVGFYKVASEGLFVGANRAYLTKPASEVKAFFFDQATAINAIDALTSGKAEIYDLNGRKLNKMQKGVNIVNGVKILVK